jgi:hypothetical protein
MLNLTTAGERDARLMAEALYWTAFVFEGRGQRHRIEKATRAEATSAAQELADRIGKPAMVYAINAEGHQALAAIIRPAAIHRP